MSSFTLNGKAVFSFLKAAACPVPTDVRARPRVSELWVCALPVVLSPSWILSVAAVSSSTAPAPVIRGMSASLCAVCYACARLEALRRVLC